MTIYKDMFTVDNIIKQTYDSYFSYVNDLPMVLHFYYLEESLYGKYGKNIKPFTHSGMVLNMLYTPFLEKDDLKLFEIDYDQGHYGSVSDEGLTNEKDVKVYKVAKSNVINKPIGTFNKYPKDLRQHVSDDYSPFNESKIWQYPYHYVSINDYINTPLKVIPQFLSNIDNGEIEVRVSQPISITGGYTIYIDGYKGDRNSGANEGLFANAGLDLPTSSTQYSQFMASSKNSFLQDNINASRQENYDMAKKTVSGISKGIMAGGALLSLATAPMTGGTSLIAGGAITGALMSSAISTGVQAGAGDVIGGALDRSLQKKNRIDSSQAKINDLLSAPRNVSLSSSDILMSLDRNKRMVYANRYVVTSHYRDRLAEYWTLFGYKQNKMMDINLKSRKYFNYIKTIDANIVGNNLDKTELETIEEIFNTGITFWHTENLQANNMEMFDYSKDNKETYDKGVE